MLRHPALERLVPHRTAHRRRILRSRLRRAHTPLLGAARYRYDGAGAASTNARVRPRNVNPFARLALADPHRDALPLADRDVPPLSLPLTSSAPRPLHRLPLFFPASGPGYYDRPASVNNNYRDRDMRDGGPARRSRRAHMCDRKTLGARSYPPLEAPYRDSSSNGVGPLAYCDERDVRDQERQGEMRERKTRDRELREGDARAGPRYSGRRGVFTNYSIHVLYLYPAVTSGIKKRAFSLAGRVGPAADLCVLGSDSQFIWCQTANSHTRIHSRLFKGRIFFRPTGVGAHWCNGAYTKAVGGGLGHCLWNSTARDQHRLPASQLSMFRHCCFAPTARYDA
ncbi:hypothetical protein C8J57DRAFT_1480166 [Mycena rebaudengoi]|nr:hypothetical protein C8J57DRAFT_1480166 [Mycena rebaudengoi]